MARVKSGVTAKARHKKVLGKAKGYYGARSKLFKTAKQAVIKAGQYAYRDRRQRKRQFRAEIEVDRKVLADIAVHDPEAFGAIAEAAKAGLELQPAAS